MGVMGFGKGQGTTYDIPHYGCAEEVDSYVVGPLNVVQFRAAQERVGSVVDLETVADQSHLTGPVPGRLCPFQVGVVSGVHSQASGQVEETSIGNCVLVVVS